MSGKYFGIKAVASVVFLVGFGISAIVVFGITHRDTAVAFAKTNLDMFDLAGQIAIFLPLKAAMAFVLAVGIWKMQDWARRGVVGISLFLLVRTAFQVLRSPSSIRAFVSHGNLVGLIVAECIVLIPIIIYLQLPSVRSNFNDDPA